MMGLSRRDAFGIAPDLSQNKIFFREAQTVAPSPRRGKSGHPGAVCRGINRGYGGANPP